MSKISHEERRKIQLTGGSTYIISLPRNWVRRTGVEKGSTLRIVQRDDLSLLIFPDDRETNSSSKEAMITSTTQDTPESIVRRMVSAYLMGYNIIKIRSLEGRLERDKRVTLKEFTRRKLVGTEILLDIPSDLTLQVLLSYKELSVKDALRRMGMIATSMHREALSSLINNDLDQAREVVAMDNDVDRFDLYIIRLLNEAVLDDRILRSIGLASPRECLAYRLITKSVERMADHAVNIAMNNLELTLTNVDEELMTQLRSLSEFALGIFEDAMKALFNEDYMMADAVLNRAQETQYRGVETIQTLVKHATPDEVSVLRLSVESLIRTADYGSDIAEAVLNLMVKDVVTETRPE